MERRPRPTVAIIIPCYQQKHFLAGAIESAVNQTVPAEGIIVVDDGSTEDLSDVISGFSGIELIKQENLGPSSARNAGLNAAASDKIIFLDADDLLLPCAIEEGLNCFDRHPEAAFVYGAFDEVRGKSKTRAFCRVTRHRDLVKCNWIGMLATVMFDRLMLLEEGGFDANVSMAEDWDTYLRLSRRHPFAAHPQVVARYVKHDSNRSKDLAELRKWTEEVRTREWERGLDSAGQRAWREGADLWRELFEPGYRRRPGVGERALRKVGLIFEMIAQRG